MCSLLSETSHQLQANPIKLQGQSPHSPTLRSGSSTRGTVTQVMISTFFSTPAVPIILQKASSQVTSSWNHPHAVLTPFHAYPQDTSLCSRESSLLALNDWPIHWDSQEEALIRQEDYEKTGSITMKKAIKYSHYGNCHSWKDRKKFWSSRVSSLPMNAPRMGVSLGYQHHSQQWPLCPCTAPCSFCWTQCHSTRLVKRRHFLRQALVLTLGCPCGSPTSFLI